MRDETGAALRTIPGYPGAKLFFLIFEQDIMTTDTVNAAEIPADAPLDAATAARNKLVISLLLVSAFVVILNETIMGVALPHLMKDLGITANAAQWLTTAFMLTMATVIPVTGFLLQRLNTRPVFLLAMTLFSIGTLISALAPGFPVLLIGRVVQATGTAVMMPLLMTTVMTLVPPASRGKTMGNISIVISVAPALGPTISGLILQVLDWRWMFWLVLPIAIGSLILGMSRIKNVSVPRYAPLDVPSVFLAAIGFGGTVYGLSSLGEGGQGVLPVPGWSVLAVGAVVLLLFILRQISLQKQDKPLLDLRTFKSRNYSISVLMMAINMMALFGALILLPIFMQNVMGLSTLQSGLLLLPGGLVMGLLAPTVGRLYDKHGTRPLLVPGAIIVSASLWALALLPPTATVWMVAPIHIVLSFGLALTFTPLFTASLGSLPMQLYSHGSAVLGTTQQVAGAAGVALFVAVMTLQSGNLLAAGLPVVEATAGGLRYAFIGGAIVSLFSIITAFMVRKPDAVQSMPQGH